MGEGGRNFLHVVCDQHDGKFGPAQGQRVQMLHQVLACRGIETSAGFVQDQKFGLRSQGACQPGPSALAKGKPLDRPGLQAAKTPSSELSAGTGNLGSVGEIEPSPQRPDKGGGNQFQAGGGWIHQRLQGIAAEAHSSAQRLDVVVPGDQTKDGNFTFPGMQPTEQREHEGRLSAAVRSQDDPAFSGSHGPFGQVQDRQSVPAQLEVSAGDGERHAEIRRKAETIAAWAAGGSSERNQDIASDPRQDQAIRFPMPAAWAIAAAAGAKCSVPARIR